MTASLLESLFKWLLILSLAVMAAAYFKKDKLPEPDFYNLRHLKDPVQQPTRKKPFATEVNDFIYEIAPRYKYELNGVVVSYHDADSMYDIYHHGSWKDFLNLRDLCVVWESNISSRAYLDVEFSNDTWTCWAFWPDRETRDRFHMTQLSNNHVISDDPYVNEQIMSAEVGDQIRMTGMLADYANRSNGFLRRTSTVRTDTGNGACETVYVTDFEIVKKANKGWRSLYSGTKALAVLSLLGFIVMLFIAPVRKGLK